MPSTVSAAMAAAGIEPSGAERWLSPVPESRPGVYVVATTEDPLSLTPTYPECPIDRDAVEELLAVRPELTLDGDRPDAAALIKRIEAFWLRDEVVLYVGLAGTSLATRVTQYHRTRLGARSPHAGGWLLKTLTILPRLWVHHAPCSDPREAEDRMLSAFAADVSLASRASLHDPDRVMPFANLEHPKGVRKRHGIAGAKEPRRQRTSAQPAGATAPPGVTARPRPSTSMDDRVTAHLRTQRVTAADLGAGRIRFPRQAQGVLPVERARIRVNLRGRELECRWDPRLGPPERSGVLGVGKALLAQLVSEGEVLRIGAGDDGLTLS